MGKNLKINLKVLIVLAIILGAMLLFTTNKVDAYSEGAITTGTPTANSLDNLPSTISLDIKESECEKVPQLIMDKVIAEFKNQGITVNTESGFTPEATVVYVGFGTKDDDIKMNTLYESGFYNVVIRVQTGDGTNIINKEVTIKYNNTTNYNDADKNYVANLMKKFQDEEAPYWINLDIYGNTKIIDAVYQKINDDSITLVPDGRNAGDIDFAQTGYFVFKDGVYYQNIQVYSNIYEVTSNVDIGNNMSVSGLLPNVSIKVTPKENAEMIAEANKVGYTKVLGTYELTLTGATSLVSPIDITFNVGTEYNGKIAYILHKKADGSYEKFEETIKSGKVTITVSELSPFVIAVKENAQEGTETTPITNNEETETTPTTNKGEKDTTPKTATIDIIGYVLVATILSGVGIVVLKKRF